MNILDQIPFSWSQVDRRPGFRNQDFREYVDQLFRYVNQELSIEKEEKQIVLIACDQNWTRLKFPEEVDLFVHISSPASYTQYGIVSEFVDLLTPFLARCLESDRMNDILPAIYPLMSLDDREIPSRDKKLLKDWGCILTETHRKQHICEVRPQRKERTVSLN